ncbi:unnamed protein product, partial [Urochloa humidicola]
LFHCRGDISGPSLLRLSRHHVPPGGTLAAQVHLAGNLALYEPSGFPLTQISGVLMHFKTYDTGSSGGGDFEMCWDTTFAALEGSVATSYQAVYAMAQYEGDLFTGDCGQCVTQAVQCVEVECGGIPSGWSIRTACPMAEAWLVSASRFHCLYADALVNLEVMSL